MVGNAATIPDASFLPSFLPSFRPSFELQTSQEALMNISQALPLAISLTHAPLFLSLSLSDPLPCGGPPSPSGTPSKRWSVATWDVCTFVSLRQRATDCNRTQSPLPFRQSAANCLTFLDARASCWCSVSLSFFVVI